MQKSQLKNKAANHQTDQLLKQKNLSEGEVPSCAKLAEQYSSNILQADMQLRFDLL